MLEQIEKFGENHHFNQANSASEGEKEGGPTSKLKFALIDERAEISVEKTGV